MTLQAGVVRDRQPATPEDSVNSHKLARLTPLGRAQMIQRLVQGDALARVARQLGLSTTTVRRWWRRYQAEGPAGRVPPGQYLVNDFPVLSAGPTPEVPLDEWAFSITGEMNTNRRWPRPSWWAGCALDVTTWSR